MWNGRQRSTSRRLERLETRAAMASAIHSYSITIHFVDREKRVTKTLLIKGDKQIWTSLEAEQAMPASERIGRQRR
jgi:DNA-binding transcriptional regulator YbjK